MGQRVCGSKEKQLRLKWHLSERVSQKREISAPAETTAAVAAVQRGQMWVDSTSLSYFTHWYVIWRLTQVVLLCRRCRQFPFFDFFMAANSFSKVDRISEIRTITYDYWAQLAVHKIPPPFQLRNVRSDQELCACTQPFYRLYSFNT